MFDRLEVVRYCSSLAVLIRREDERSRTTITEIQLAHFSVQEYLKSTRLEESMAADLNEMKARAAIVRVCLSYLLDLDSSYDPQKEREKYPLARYSAQYWPTHAAAVEVSKKTISQEEQEYLSRPEVFLLGYRLYHSDQPWQGLAEGELVPALYYVSFFGLLYSVQWLLDKGTDVNAQGGYYGNALQAASVGGHEKVVQLLLDKGADVNAQGGECGNALQAASDGGHEKVVQLLLDKGAVTIQRKGDLVIAPRRRWQDRMGKYKVIY